MLTRSLNLPGDLNSLANNLLLTQSLTAITAHHQRLPWILNLRGLERHVHFEKADFSKKRESEAQHPQSWPSEHPSRPFNSGYLQSQSLL
jgi:hypothetical protein